MIDIVHTKYYVISSGIIRDFVSNCETCIRNDKLTIVPDIHINIISHKQERYIMDFIDISRYSDYNDGYCWILNVIDTYTKYLFSFKMYYKTA